ncbi:Uncharacterised protein [Escherichia coli]|uniref:Uncharacterized protein n=1 Tax=Escherichia coli TaxID=562 RepID=A0A377E5C7_ECOLX|nr:Uncharacterised protein [Escherichia coli]
MGWQFGFCHTFKLHEILQIMLVLYWLILP